MVIDAEGSELLADVFNHLTNEQKNRLHSDTIRRMCRFMDDNGYRMVFCRWYKQAEPYSEGVKNAT